MAKNLASCQFCSRPDDSIQILCESRCLICSRCQVKPIIRKLLLDHCDFSSQTSQNQQPTGQPNGSSVMVQGVNDDSYPQKANNPFTSMCGTCPICSAPVSVNMLFFIQTLRENFKPDEDETVRKNFLFQIF
jgi:hypothetical protein